MEGSQTDRLYNLLKDFKWHSTLEIMSVVYSIEHSGICRISGRILDCKKKYNCKIEGRKDDVNKAIYWYRIMLDNPWDKVNPETEIQKGNMDMELYVNKQSYEALEVIPSYELKRQNIIKN